MSWPWNRRGGHGDLEQMLRSDRPQPREDFVRALAARAGADAARRELRRRPRVALAGALTAAMLAVAAAFGGFGYAASAVQHVASSVKSVLVAGGGGAIDSNLTSGGDQYQPGFAWGDPSHNHDGAPGLSRQGGALAPPLVATCRAGKAVAVVRLVLDEQADLDVTVRDRRGTKLPIVQPDGTTGDSISYRVLVPRAMRLRLQIPCDLLQEGKTYRIRIAAVDPDGNRSTLVVPLRTLELAD